MPIKKIVIPCLLILFFALSACTTEKTGANVTSILYTVDTVSLPPDLQSREIYTFTPESVTMKREGKSDTTQVYEGEWKFTADSELLSPLFALAAQKECKEYISEDSGSMKVGAPLESIKLTFESGDSCEITFDPGTTIKGAESLLDGIHTIVDNLQPAAAATVE